MQTYKPDLLISDVCTSDGKTVHNTIQHLPVKNIAIQAMTFKRLNQ